MSGIISKQGLGEIVLVLEGLRVSTYVEKGGKINLSADPREVKGCIRFSRPSKEGCENATPSRKIELFFENAGKGKKGAFFHRY